MTKKAKKSKNNATAHV